MGERSFRAGSVICYKFLSICYVPGLLAAGAMALWHGVEFYEKEKAVGEEYYKQWPYVSYDCNINLESFIFWLWTFSELQVAHPNTLYKLYLSRRTSINMYIVLILVKKNTTRLTQKAWQKKIWEKCIGINLLSLQL